MFDCFFTFTQMRRIKWITCLILIHFCNVANSQILRFKNYTTANGLLSDEVYNLHHDKQGYLWVFTNYGTLKYNSSEFNQVLKNLPFSDSFIYSMYENPAGEKWVANSKAKIYKVLNDSAFIVKGTEEISEQLNDDLSEIIKLYVDDTLNIYAITKHRSYKFINNHGSYSPVNLSAQIANDSVAYIVLRKDSELLPIFNFKEASVNHWFEPKGRIGIFFPSLKTGKMHFYDYTFDHRGALRRLLISKGSIYFSQYDKLVRTTEGKIKMVNFGTLINNIIKDKRGHTWVACLKDGIYELDENDSIIHHYLQNITINDLVMDSQNGLFASSAEQGLFHCENLNDLYFGEDSPLSNLIAFLRVLDNKLFVATANGELFLMKNEKPIFITKGTNQGIPLNIYKDGSRFLLSYTFGIKEFTLDKNYVAHFIYHANNDKAVNVLKIIEKKGDSLIYLGRRGIGRIFNHSVIKRNDFNLKTFDCVIRGDMYVLATDKGIYTKSKRITDGRLKATGDFPIFQDSLFQVPYLAKSKNVIIKHITCDSANRLWFSTIGSGIFVLDESERLDNLTAQTGLPSNIIYDICYTPDNKILICTNKGLYLSSSKNEGVKRYFWNKIYPGEIKNIQFFEGKIYVATKNGLATIDYSKIKDKGGIKFNLRSIFLNSRLTQRDALRNVAYNQNNIDFEFDLIDFSGAKSGLKYYLSGPVSDSGIINGNFIKLLKIKPGSYKLIVYPDIQDGEVLEIVVPFTVVPAWWQTLTFYIVLSLTSLVTIFSGVTYLIRNRQKKREQKQRAEKMIQEYQLIALKAQINPHFISNCLSAVQLLIIHNKVAAAIKYIAKFGLLVRQILNFSTKSLVSVAEEIEIAALNIELEQLRFDDRFKYDIRIDPKIDPKNIYIPSLILNPIIENAIWHGLIPLKNIREGLLQIEVKASNDMLLLVVEDNGVGRKPVAQNISNNRQSKGIQITEQRLININYLYSITSAKINYIDLYDENNHPGGTRVVIALPLNLIPLQHE